MENCVVWADGVFCVCAVGGIHHVEGGYAVAGLEVVDLGRRSVSIVAGRGGASLGGHGDLEP